jgi:hypothetical protein
MATPLLLQIFFLFSLAYWCTFVHGNCSEDADCGFNGICNIKTNLCKCDSAWHGRYCHQLTLLPTKNMSGLDLLRTNYPISTWGGSVLFSEDDEKYHMWASEIGNNCGIHHWLSASRIVHAVSLGPPDWKFSKVQVVWPIFSHEPVVVRAPTGEYAMYFTHQPSGPASDARCNCTNGNSYSGGDDCAHEPWPSKNATLYSYFSWSDSPHGPWTKPVSLAGPQIAANISSSVDMNLSPVILLDGSVIAWTRWAIWRASDWRNASTYKDTGQAPDWDHGGVWEGEDPHLWVDGNGKFHILSHNGGRGKDGATGDCGRHLYSESGLAGTWRAAPLPLGGCAFPRSHVSWEEGGERTFYRRERPHLIFAPDGITPIALSTSVIDSPSIDAQSPQRDASYTLIQRVEERTGVAQTE